MTALELMIRDEIHACGPMRFDRYMERALHHPEHGYYAAGRPIGREGDFFTSVSVGPLFGQLLARQARQMWRALDCPRPFWIFEQGAHDGQLALDILESCRSGQDDFFAAARYGIVEPSPSARELQEHRVIEAKLDGHVCWLRDLREAGGEKPAGIFISNELVDAFPVRLIHRNADAWMERCVEVDDEGSLSWIDVSIEDEKLGEAIRGLPLPEIEGYVTEINLTAPDWMREVAQVFERGYVLTIDYGFPASLYYAPFRSGGTLTTYRDHRRDDDVLHSPGEKDITAHVDFTALARAGESGGLTTLGLIDQQRFLMGVAQSELSGAEKYENGIPNQLRAWNTLTHPEHLGSRFQVLVQAKNAPGTLDGLRFARPGGLD